MDGTYVLGEKLNEQHLNEPRRRKANSQRRRQAAAGAVSSEQYLVVDASAGPEYRTAGEPKDEEVDQFWKARSRAVRLLQRPIQTSLQKPQRSEVPQRPQMLAGRNAAFFGDVSPSAPVEHLHTNVGSIRLRDE